MIYTADYLFQTPFKIPRTRCKLSGDGDTHNPDGSRKTEYPNHVCDG